MADGFNATRNFSLGFIDDAGDAGFKFDRCSTRYFVIACVVFDTPRMAEAASAAMRQLRRDFGWNQKHEFKFNKLRREDTKRTLIAMSEHEFRIRAAIVDKTIVQSHEMRTKPSSFYHYVIKEVLLRDSKLHNARIMLDGSAGKQYRQQAVAYFRKTVNIDRRVIADFKITDSKKNNLVQLADLIAGSLYHSMLTYKTDAQTYRNIIKKHIEDIWNFT